PFTGCTEGALPPPLLPPLPLPLKAVAVSSSSASGAPQTRCSGNRRGYRSGSALRATRATTSWKHSGASWARYTLSDMTARASSSSETTAVAAPPTSSRRGWPPLSDPPLLLLLLLREDRLARAPAMLSPSMHARKRSSRVSGRASTSTLSSRHR
ncbi:unnamed protein product, partial [Ectocarpus fasciculatus]